MLHRAVASLRARPELLRQTSPMAMPMSRYRIVHAMGNSQSGGAAGGFTSRSKSAMPARVAKLDAPPTASAIAQKATYGRIRFHLFNLHHLGQDQDALVYVPPSCKIRANRGKLFALF